MAGHAVIQNKDPPAGITTEVSRESLPGCPAAPFATTVPLPDGDIFMTMVIALGGGNPRHAASLRLPRFAIGAAGSAARSSTRGAGPMAPSDFQA